MAEDGAEAIIGVYQRHGAAWAEARLASETLMEAEWLRRFLSPLPAGAHLLDMGCGAGEPLAGHCIRQGFSVTGVDTAPWMIETCRKRFPDQCWLLADMRSLSLDQQFDGVLAWDSFFHLSHEDQRQMFPIFRRHLAPGGMVMFTSGPAHGEAIGQLEGEPLYHASLAPETYLCLLDRHGFDLVAHQAEDPACGGHTVWLARLRQGVSPSPDSSPR